MLYNQYLRSAANTTAIFEGACDAIAEKYPNAKDAQTACRAAADDYATRESYESYENFMDAASHLAETLLFGTPGIGTQDLQNLTDAAEEYSSTAKNIAETYIGNREDEPPNLDWVQLQNDGVYISGDEGTAGVTSSSFPWPDVIPPRRRRYPENVPVVPPQIIPTGKKKIRKLRPPEGDPKGCVNKRDPQIGEIVMIQTTNPISDVFWVLYWDNIVLRTESKSYGSQSVYDEHLKGTPAAMPAFANVAKFANLAPGRYVIESVNHNESVVPMGHLSEFYDTVERWAWQYQFTWGDMVEESHASEYHECLSIAFGDYTGAYFYPSKVINGDWAGGGSATSYTLGRIQMRYQGIFPPVSEDKHAGAYLAIHQINTFNILTSMLLGRAKQ